MSVNAVVATNTLVKVNNVNVSGDINQVKLNLKQAMVDVSNFTSGVYKDFLPGANEGTLDYTAFFNKGASGLNATIAALFGAPSSAAPWEVDIPDSNTGSIKYTGNGWATSDSPDVKIHDAVKETAALQITGGWTRAVI